MLTERQLLILEAIVQEYTTIGRPVGSKSLGEQLPMQVSSATIRNEMATLERLGFIGKEHSSSGRVPTLQGYRYYIDNLVKPDIVNQNNLKVLEPHLATTFIKLMKLLLSQLVCFRT